MEPFRDQERNCRRLFITAAVFFVVLCLTVFGLIVLEKLGFGRMPVRGAKPIHFVYGFLLVFFILQMAGGLHLSLGGIKHIVMTPDHHPYASRIRRMGWIILIAGLLPICIVFVSFVTGL